MKISLLFMGRFYFVVLVWLTIRILMVLFVPLIGLISPMPNRFLMRCDATVPNLYLPPMKRHLRCRFFCTTRWLRRLYSHLSYFSFVNRRQRLVALPLFAGRISCYSACNSRCLNLWLTVLPKAYAIRKLCLPKRIWLRGRDAAGPVP